MKFILFLLLIGSLLTIDSPFINDIRGKLLGLVSNIASSEYAENRITDTVSAEIVSHFNTLNDAEEEFIKPFLFTPDGLLKFHRNYCEHDAFKTEISAQNRRKICQIVDRQLDAIENEGLRNS